MSEIKISDAKENILSQLNIVIGSIVQLAQRDINELTKEAENTINVLKQHHKQ